jgi:hypothetical protein
MVIKRRSTNGKYIYEEVFNILSHKRKTNHSETTVQSHPSQNGYHQENKQQQMLVRM